MVACLDFDPVCETMFQLVMSMLQQASRRHELPEDMVLFVGDLMRDLSGFLKNEAPLWAAASRASRRR